MFAQLSAHARFASARLLRSSSVSALTATTTASSSSSSVLPRSAAPLHSQLFSPVAHRAAPFSVSASTLAFNSSALHTNWLSCSLKCEQPDDHRLQQQTQRCISTGRPGTTYHFQKSMPRLPIPELDDSLSKYMRAVSPLLSPEELERTQAAVEAFRTGEGPALHAELKARDAADPENSFINPFWDDMYLESRVPLPINVNPFLQFTSEERPAMQDMCKRAANFLHASALFRIALKNESLEPDVFHVGEVTNTSWFKTLITFIPEAIAYYPAYLLKGYPLDMCQYPRLFGTTRLPHESRDIVQTAPDSRHVVVALGGRFYRMDIVNADDSAVSFVDLEAQLRGLLKAHEAGQLQAGDANVGLFTTLERTRWSQLRKQLEECSAQNRSSLESIDSALFTLCLDAEAEPTGHASAAHTFLHSDGRNRWFDKSFSAVVTRNGKAALNFEHSWGDGVSVLRFANEVYDEMLSTEVWADVTAEQVEASPLPQALPFELDASLRTEVERAERSFEKLCKSLCFEVMSFEDFGKDVIKGFKISPDGLVQMAMQLAYHRLYHRLASTYESASTAGFRKGRTECIRPVSPAVVELIKAFGNPTATNEERQAALRTAVDSHSANSLEAKIGKGMDRHLYALLCIAKQKNPDQLPSLFADPAWTLLNHNILSTSTLVSPAIEGGGFGPVVEDGYGVGYGVVDDGMRFAISSYKDADETHRYAEEIREALRDIRTVLEGLCGWAGDPLDPVKSINEQRKTVSSLKRE